MDHSVTGYLRRQPTEILELLLLTYRVDAQEKLHRDIAALVRQILRERGIGA